MVIPDEKKVQKSFRNGSCMGPKKVVLIGIYFFTIKLPNAHPHLVAFFSDSTTVEVYSSTKEARGGLSFLLPCLTSAILENGEYTTKRDQL